MFNKFLFISLIIIIFLYSLDTIGQEGIWVDTPVSKISEAIKTLQPYYFKEPLTKRKSKFLYDLSKAIRDSTKEFNIDPMIAVSIARRESSLLPSVGLGMKQTKFPERGPVWVGPNDEKGYFQILPDSAVERVCNFNCNQFNPYCNSKTAMCWLNHSREICGSNPWQFVAGYGLPKCVSTEHAKRLYHVRRARNYFVEILGNRAESRWSE